MEFNKKLKFLREKRGYTQEELAFKLNISRQSVSKWENGINEPDIETIKKICDILDCSLKELLDDNNKIITTKEMRVNKRETQLFYWNISIFILSILICLVFIRAMNKEVIIHWDSNWNPTYGSKWMHLFSLLGTFTGFIFSIIAKFGLGKLKKYYEDDKDKIQLVGLIMQLVCLILIIVFMIMSDTYDESSFIVLISGIMISCIIPMAIFSHPRFNKRNLYFGLKTAFTLSSDEAWNKVNSFASFAMGVAAIISLILYFIIFSLGMNFFFILYIPLVISAISICVYHRILNKK